LEVVSEPEFALLDVVYDNGQQIREQLSSNRVAGAGTVLGLGARLFRYDSFGRLTGVYADFMETETPIAEYRYNELGQRIMWRYDQDASGTVAATERFFYMYDDRWRMVGAFWDSGATPQEFFVYHAAGNAGRGGVCHLHHFRGAARHGA